MTSSRWPGSKTKGIQRHPDRCGLYPDMPRLTRAVRTSGLSLKRITAASARYFDAATADILPRRTGLCLRGRRMGLPFCHGSHQENETHGVILLRGGAIIRVCARRAKARCLLSLEKSQCRHARCRRLVGRTLSAIHATDLSCLVTIHPPSRAATVTDPNVSTSTCTRAATARPPRSTARALGGIVATGHAGRER